MALGGNGDRYRYDRGDRTPVRSNAPKSGKRPSDDTPKKAGAAEPKPALGSKPTPQGPEPAPKPALTSTPQPESTGIQIVKNRGRRRQTEAYDETKLHRSITGACLASGVPIGYAESIARKVTSEVERWLEDRPEVTSNDLRRIAAQKLKPFHPDASYLYEHNRTTL